MLKRAVASVILTSVFVGAPVAMAKDVRPSAVTFSTVAAKPAADVPAPARARVTKRHDLFGLSGLALLGVAAGVGLTAGLVAVATSGNSSPS